MDVLFFSPFLFSFLSFSITDLAFLGQFWQLSSKKSSQSRCLNEAGSSF